MRKRFSHKAFAGPTTIRSMYPLSAFDDFKAWLYENTTCLPGSKYPCQIVSVISRYLFHASSGAPLNRRTWSNVHHGEKLDKWISTNADLGAGASTIYNYLGYVDKASQFLYAARGIAPPRGFNKFIRQKKKLYRRRRRADVQRHLFQNETEGPRSLAPIAKSVLLNNSCMVKFNEAVDMSKRYLAKGHAVFDMCYFVFAMRLAMMHMVTSMGSRPSAIYTLTSDHVGSASGSWSGDEPVVIRNPDHKTGTSCGPARLVISREGKDIFHMYMEYVRKAAMQFLGLTTSYTFFNSNGNKLCSSTLSASLIKLQRQCGVQKPLTTTQIRKCVTSTLRCQDVGSSAGNEWVAAGLCHSVSTSNRHYVLTGRDENAVALHRAIMDMLTTARCHQD